MATHPLAIKLEEAIERAKRVRDALKRMPVPTAKGPEEEKKPRGTRNTGAVIDLGAYGIGGPPVEITAGGATKMFDLVPGPALAKLLQELADETKKCQESQTRVQYSGRYDVNPDGQRVWVAGGNASKHDRSCPGVLRVQKEIAKLIQKGNAYIINRR